MTSTLSPLVPTQAQLEVIVRDLFNKHDVQINTRKKTAVMNPNSSQPLELDIWVASKDICFEFQDSYHYMTTWYSQVPLHSIQSRDNAKKQTIKRRGSTLVEVPYWWDSMKESLLATILFQRPELKFHIAQNTSSYLRPISLNPPQADLLTYGSVPDVGTLMLASFPALAVQFSQTISEDDSWWMGEKYDGVLCCWNPLKRALYSRTGIEVSMLESYKDKMRACDMFFCGELWCGRGKFAETQQLVTAAISFNWSSLRLIAFDDPSPGMSREYQRPFESRYTSLLTAIHSDHPCIIVAGRMSCLVGDWLSSWLGMILRDEGEGVVLRRPRSPYVMGRSEHLVKLKATRTDQEALVVSITESKTESDENRGDIYVKLQLQTGIVFTVIQRNEARGSGDLQDIAREYTQDTARETILDIAQRDTITARSGRTGAVATEYKLKKGDIVTVAYDHCSRDGTPIDATIRHVRRDGGGGISSDSGAIDSPTTRFSAPRSLDESSQRVFGTPVKAESFWKTEKKRKLRDFFEKVARDNNFDPLVPSSWYSFSRHQFVQIKGGSAVLGHFEGGMAKALKTLFPEVVFDSSQFNIVPKAFWKKLQNRKEVFDSFAKSNSFDPLQAENWYPYSYSSMCTTKSMASVLHYYGNNIKRALSHVYPNIGLDHSKFVAKYNWTDIENRKSVILQFAKEQGFDPLVVNNWNHVSPSSISKITQLLTFYGGSLSAALNHLYPQLKNDLRELKR